MSWIGVSVVWFSVVDCLCIDIFVEYQAHSNLCFHFELSHSKIVHIITIMSFNQFQPTLSRGEPSVLDMGYMKIGIHEANLSPELLSHTDISLVSPSFNHTHHISSHLVSSHSLLPSLSLSCLLSLFLAPSLSLSLPRSGCFPCHVM